MQKSTKGEFTLSSKKFSPCFAPVFVVDFDDMKLDLTPEQAKWLGDVLRRWDVGEPIADDEVDALATYWNDDYVDWIDDKEERGAQLTTFEDAYRGAMGALVGDGKQGRVRVLASRPPVSAGGSRPRRKSRGGCFGNLVGLAILALLVRFAWGVVREAIDNPPPALVATSPAAPKPVKSVAEVVAAKAAKARAAEQPAVPARSEWRTITYIGGDDREHPALVGDDRSGGCLVIRDPRGACLFEIQTPKSLPMGGATEWTGPIQIGKRVLSTEQWFRQGDRVGMMRLVDERGDFEPGHGRDLLARLVAEDESGNIIVGYLRPGGGKWSLSIPLRGLRAAIDDLPPL